MTSRPLQLALAVGLLGALLGAPSGAPAGAQEAVPDPAFQRLATCVGDTGHLLVLVLMDESGSLQWMDPDATRVTALQSSLRHLAMLGSLEVDGVTPRVEVMLSAFAVGFRSMTGWEDLDRSSVGRLSEEAEVFADLDEGLDTDFAMGFRGAQEELARRSAEVTQDGEPSPCKVILVFTDGDYDVELRDTPWHREQGLTKPYAEDLPLDVPGNPERVEEIGKELICSPRGLADELRDSDVVTVTLALTEETSPEDRAFLEAVSTGRAEDTRCGDVVGDEHGSYIAAGDLWELLRAFDRVAGGIARGTVIDDVDEVPVCVGEACPEGQREFVLDGSVGRFHLLANVGSRDVTLELRSPGGDVLTLRPGEDDDGRFAGADVSATWLSPVDVAVDGFLPAETDEWHGTWTATFVAEVGVDPDAVARSQIILFGHLSPRLVEAPMFRMGEATTLDIEVVDGAGAVSTPADFVESAVMTGDITDPTDGSTSELSIEGPGPDGRYTATYDVPDDIEASFVQLTLTLDIVTSGGVSLQPTSRRYSVEVAPPLVFPTISPAELRLSSISQRGVATGTLTVTGGEGAGGCVWFPTTGVTDAPRLAGGFRISLSPDATTEERCVAVGEGETAEVEVTFEPDDVRSGSVRGLIHARATTDASDQVISRAIPVGFEMFRPVHEALRLGLFALLMTLGLALPLVAMWGLNWMTARYVAPGRTRHTSMTVRVPVEGVPHRVREDGSDQPLGLDAIEPQDLNYVRAPTQPVRSFQTVGLTFDRRVPALPWNAPYGLVRSGDAHAAAIDGHEFRDGVSHGRLPFALQHSWIFVVEKVEKTGLDESEDGSGIEAVMGSLHLFLADAPLSVQGPQLLEAVERELPGAAIVLAAEVAEREPPPQAQEDEPTGETNGGVADEGWRPPGAGSKTRPSAGGWSPGQPSPETGRDDPFAGGRPGGGTSDAPGEPDSSATPRADEADDDPDAWQPPPP